ncbi:hypothetical protein SynBIOSU31_01219 [Synechococcus sp. BIOS-U3-1]|nr:hypothetical protein SynBIOSU31_01219 [Synechococcus sp. BIOS-U3-1]|tara:strand:- start:6520 stop:6633 length:114 start_codon:yes stop_codon:yes gene_type:complete
MVQQHIHYDARAFVLTPDEVGLEEKTVLTHHSVNLFP